MFAFKNLKTSIKYAVLTIVVVVGAIFFQKTSYKKTEIEHSKRKTFSPEELSLYNGVQKKNLHLAVVGNVFDVTVGRKHYEKGSPYHYFIGKDGTRALVTGDFKDETDDKDHILDLPCKDLLMIMQWRQTFKQKYTYVGLLIGRYYDENGTDTVYMREMKQKLKQCKIKKEEDKKQEKLYPPCNISWSEKDGAKVWCTKSSGGIAREWVGVPRQMYTPGEEKPQCVCVNLERADSYAFKEYDGCAKTSTECAVINS